MLSACVDLAQHRADRDTARAGAIFDAFDDPTGGGFQIAQDFIGLDVCNDLPFADSITLLDIPFDQGALFHRQAPFGQDDFNNCHDPTSHRRVCLL